MNDKKGAIHVPGHSGLASGVVVATVVVVVNGVGVVYRVVEGEGEDTLTEVGLGESTLGGRGVGGGVIALGGKENAGKNGSRAPKGPDNIGLGLFGGLK